MQVASPSAQIFPSSTSSIAGSPDSSIARVASSVVWRSTSGFGLGGAARLKTMRFESFVQRNA
jgi:hypothetical protein